MYTVAPTDEIVSPGRPMTRLTSTAGPPASAGTSWNTTMSPRWMVEESLSTMIRSPGISVGVIDGVGTK